jgi:hypothetical protein
MEGSPDRRSHRQDAPHFVSKLLDKVRNGMFQPGTAAMEYGDLTPENPGGHHTLRRWKRPSRISLWTCARTGHAHNTWRI